jgi:hypothetical protein
MAPADICAICGAPIPFYSSAASEAEQALSEFDTLADGRYAHGVCLDREPRRLFPRTGQLELVTS